MRSRHLTLSVVVTLAALALASSSAAREFPDIYTECGLGALIAPRNTAVAAVTNVTWDSGTTAISSNITSPDTCQGGQEKTAAFIHDSYALLEQDLARGSGTYLDTLLVMAACDSNTHPAVAEALRLDFTALVETPGYPHQSRFEKANGLYDLLYGIIEADFTERCTEG